jgi:NAD-dependent dihydropyrimidine dehydrogenase PreA subunit
MPGETSSIFEIDCDLACEGCPAASDGFAVTEVTEQCPHYESYVIHADGHTVEVTHYNCNNAEMLGKFVGAGLLVSRNINPLTGEEIK